MVKNRRSLLDSCHEAFWSFPDDTLSSDRRIAAVLLAIAEHPLADRTFLCQTARTILMADIAMCQGDECPVKENCWRYMAPSDRFQSYFATPPYTEEGCEYFWDMNEK
jgi:hypothetical protein